MVGQACEADPSVETQTFIPTGLLVHPYRVQRPAPLLNSLFVRHPRYLYSASSLARAYDLTRRKREMVYGYRDPKPAARAESGAKDSALSA